MVIKKIADFVSKNNEDDFEDIDIKKYHISELIILLFYSDIFSNYLQQKNEKNESSNIILNKLYRIIRSSGTYIDEFAEDRLYPVLTLGLKSVFQRALRQPPTHQGVFLRIDAFRNAFLRLPATKLKTAFVNPKDYTNINKCVHATLVDDEKLAIESLKNIVIQIPQIKILIRKISETILNDDYDISVSNTIQHITKETDSLSHIIQERENTPITSPEYQNLKDKEQNIATSIKNIANSAVDKDDSATKADVVELTSTMIANEKHIKAFSFMEPDEEQKSAIFASGKVLVAASAGSGKTQTLTTKVGYLIKDKNVDPSSIFVTTFTKNAANEMKERIQKQVGEYPDMFIGTQHSFGLEILKQHGSPEYKQAIKNTQMQRSAFKLDRLIGYALDEYSEYTGSKPILSPKEVTLIIASWKYDLVEPDEVDAWLKKNNKDKHIDTDLFEAAEVYKIVETIKGRNKIMKKSPYYRGSGKNWDKRLLLAGTTPVINYDDMLCDFLRLLIEKPDVKEMLQKRFNHFIMDEAQDSNNAQLEIFRLLTEKIDDSGTAWLVGDDSQSIYGFRSAKPEFFINLYNNPEWKVRKIGTNYRCASKIVQLANSLILHNKNRIPMEAKASRKNEGEISLQRSTIESMANTSISEISDTIEIDPSKKFDNFSVIARTNNDLNDFEAACIINNVPYSRRGGMNFFNRKEIRMILGYMTLALSDDTTEINKSLLDVYDYPNRFLGEKFASALKLFKGSYFDSLTNPQLLSQFNYQSSSIKRLHTDIINLKNTAQSKKTIDLLEEILKIHGAKEDIKSFIEISVRDEDAEEGVQEENVTLGGVSYLIKMMGKDSRFPNVDGAIPEQFFVKVQKMKETMKELHVESGGVVLSTIHAAKGLQYHKVFAVIKPPSKYVDTDQKLEEERRMAYVQMTRAKDELTVLSPALDSFGRKLDRSQFISESGIDRLDEQPEDTKNASINYNDIERILEGISKW